MLRGIKRALHHVGRRGVVLLFFGLLWVSSGQSYLKAPPIEAANFTVVFQLMSPTILGWGMTMVGNAMLLAAFWKSLEDVAFALSAAVAAFLGLGTLAGYIPGVAGPSPSAPRIIAIYATYCLLVLVVSGWPEPPSSLPPRQDKDGN